MTEYRRRKGSDTWHFEPTCSWWPTEGYDETERPDGDRPRSGELCDECKAKAKQDQDA